MIARVAARYEARIAAGAAAEPQLAERDRLAVALVALGNQERALVLDILAGRAASPAVTQVLLDQADALVEGARADGRLGYRRAADAALAFGPRFVPPILSIAGSARSAFSRIGSPSGSKCC